MDKTENNNIISAFIKKLNQSIAEKKFIKLSFSKSIGTEAPKNIYAKLIESKKGQLISFTLRYKNKDITQNIATGLELDKQIELWIGNTFKIATLICAEEEIVLLFNNKNKAQLRTKQTALKPIGTNMHDKEKNYLIKEDTAFLKLLSVSSKEGKVFSDQQDKYRQINKYCEIMLAQFEQHQLFQDTNKPIRIVDMGSGKGYLTFALCYLLKEKMQLNVEMLGIELREELCRFCNEQAVILGWSDYLKFSAMDIMQFEGNIDVLIALHACDIATDIAIAKGIENAAGLIVVAPCCHKQIRKEMTPKAPWKNILKNGILLEREAELITDAIRALLLECEGYKTKVFEFISGEHTPKNLMITAGRSKNKSTEAETLLIENEIAELKSQFGIGEHYLEKLLKGKA
jgi:hypothetical protein